MTDRRELDRDLDRLLRDSGARVDMVSAREILRGVLASPAADDDSAWRTLIAPDAGDDVIDALQELNTRIRATLIDDGLERRTTDPVVAATIGLASTWLATRYGAPVMLFALLLGMAFHFLHEDGRCLAGIEFASRTVLRIGVALLGVRITLDQLAGLGTAPVVIVLGGVATTIFLGWAFARALKLHSTFGVLSGGAVAICGASAALAIASVLPKSSRLEADTILTVVLVTAFSTVAMVIYPIFAESFGMNHATAGIFLGGTIHDVAQVVGAGYTISDETGEIATYVKLLRVAMLLPVVFIIAAVVSATQGPVGETRVQIPYFLIGFAVLVLVNSTGTIPEDVRVLTADASRWFLVTAIAALGMKTSLRQVFAVGWKPIGLVAVETGWIFVFVIAGIYILA